MDLRALIKLIVVDFSGSQTDALEKAREFCRASFQEYGSFSDTVSWETEVVTEALRSFNDCMALEREGVRIGHEIAQGGGQHGLSSEYIAFTFDFNPERVRLRFRSMGYPEDVLQCTTSAFSPEVNGQREQRVINGSTPEQAIPGSASIACKRIGDARSSGNRKNVSILISTSAGIYSAMLPGDPVNDPTPEELRQCKQTNDIIQRKNANLQQAHDLAMRALGNSLTIHVIRRGQNSIPGFEHVPCGGDPDLQAKGVCGAQVMASFRKVGAHRGGACGYTYYVYLCLPAPRT